MTNTASRRPPTFTPKVTTSISEVLQDEFASDAWRPTRTALTPIPTALWRGIAGMCYVVQNANVVRPAAIEYLAQSGEYIRQTYMGRPFTRFESDDDILRDALRRVWETYEYIDQKLGD